MPSTKNYVLGRGKLYFARFIEGTQTPDAFLYFGNTPEFSISMEIEDLPHYSMDEGIREEDDNVVLEVTRNSSLVTDNIQPENVALFFMGDASVLTQAAVAAVSFEIAEARAGYSYQIGQSDLEPMGVMGLNSAGFLVHTGAAVAATGTLTVGVGNATAADTITIAGRTYTFRASAPAEDEVLIGATVTDTATNLVRAINGGAGEGTLYGTGTEPHVQVSAENTAGVVTFTSLVQGVAGNSLALTRVGTNLTVSGATLTGGANGVVLVEDVDYTVNLDTGLISFTNDSAIVDGATDIVVNYAIRASTRDVVLSGNAHVEGALRFESKNARGPDAVFYMPWIKIAPSGDYNLKGDDWQQLPLQVRILRKEGEPAIRRNGVPVYQ